ncbi:hypothetical protein KUV85_05875 [Nocardioides panacisoli]|uniref:DUF6167 family protein n=1 Tax=Nocardioides panacisoli TaxID=627624 RepID=UPI001C63198B|nr:DUF6167 family protein [Nocardioides panacisoli]QYJ05208.1 hypothetical protein KUV85_05875 [Nocardioides panacisoli]
MIRAGFFFAAGAAAGVYGSLKAKRFADEFTAEGVRHRVKAASLGARLFREEVARGQAEAEVELRERYELGDENRRALPGPDAPDSPRPIPPQEDTD